MQLSFPDVLSAIDQLVTATSSEFHRSALLQAREAINFRHTVDTAIERHHREQRDADVAVPAAPTAGVWPKEEDALLRIAFEAGMTLDAIAVRHRRTPVDVANRLFQPLGILTAQAVEEIKSARVRHRPKDEPLAPTPQAVPTPVPAAVVLVDKPAQMPQVAPVLGQEPAIAMVAEGDVVTKPDTPNVAADRPKLTADEEKAVSSVLTKFTVKNAPRATLRTYIESPKFSTKLSPEALDWLRAELIRLG